MTILVTPEERSEMAAKADRLGLNVSEFLRLAAGAFDETETEPLLLALAEQIEEAVSKTNKRLDETHAFVASTLAEMRKERERAVVPKAA